MKKTISYLLVLYLVSYMVLGILYYLDFIDKLFISSALYAAVLNILNIILALLLYYFSIGKSNSTFLMLNLGGMGVRLFFLLVSVFIFLKFLKIDKYAFIFIFFIFYFLQIIFEIAYLNKRAKNTGNK